MWRPGGRLLRVPLTPVAAPAWLLRHNGAMVLTVASNDPAAVSQPPGQAVCRAPGPAARA